MKLRHIKPVVNAPEGGLKLRLIPELRMVRAEHRANGEFALL